MKQRNTIQRWFAVSRVQGLNRREKTLIRAVLSEYARKVPHGQVANPQELSYLESALVSESVLIDWPFARASGGILDLVSQCGRMGADAEAASRAAQRFASQEAAVPEKAALAHAERILENIRKECSQILQLKESLEGERSIKRLLGPNVVRVINILVFLASWILQLKDFLEVTSLDAFSAGQKVGALAVGTTFSAISPAIVVVCAVAIGRVLAVRRATDRLSEMGADRTGIVLSLDRPGVSWFSILASWMRKYADGPWLGVAFLAAASLTLVSALTAIVSRFGWSLLTDSTSALLPGQLQVAAVVVLALPIAVLVVNMAGSNELADLVDAADKKLESANSDVDMARTAVALSTESHQQEKETLERRAQEMDSRWRTFFRMLEPGLDTAVATDASEQARGEGKVVQLLLIGRGLNDRMPLGVPISQHASVIRSAVKTMTEERDAVRETRTRELRAVIRAVAPPELASEAGGSAEGSRGRF